MRALELFAGTGSVGKTLKDHGYNVISVDISDKYHTHEPLTHKVDILDFDYKQYPRDHFDIVWASPPCNTFSRINSLAYRGNPDKIKERIEQQGLPLLRKTLEIAHYFNLKDGAQSCPRSRIVIENPKGLMSQYIQQEPLYQDMKMVELTADYCMYSDFGYRKRTNFWTTHPVELELCNRRCDNMVGTTHRQQITHKEKTTIEDRYRVPNKLIEQLCFG